MNRILQATTEAELDHVRNLMRSFVSWQRERNKEDIDLVNEYFNPVVIEKELASLPGKYAMPDGRLLLAFIDDHPAGCVGLRKIDAKTCEMKRMFVDPKFQGKGIAFAMAQKLIEEARVMGYETMLLDTSFRQTEAQALYQKIGFKKTKPYYELPKKVEDWLVFMEMKLR
jgi:GNAT superfamily N-acetyltransferase